jgi:AraC-like DNA-binding protein
MTILTRLHLGFVAFLLFHSPISLFATSTSSIVVDSLHRLIQNKRRAGDVQGEASVRIHYLSQFSENPDPEVLEESLDFFQAHQLDENYYSTLAHQIKNMCVNGEYDKAMQKAMGLREKAKAKVSEIGVGMMALTLADISRHLGHQQEVLDYEREAIEHLKKTSCYTSLWWAYGGFCHAALRSGHEHEAIAPLEEWKKSIARVHPFPQGDVKPDSSWLLWVATATDTYTFVGDLEKAHEYILQTERWMAGDDTSDNRIMITGLWINYYEKAGKYKKALDLLTGLVPPAILKANKEVRLHTLKEEAELADKIPLYSQAASYWKEACLLQDTLQQEKHKADLDRLRTEFAVDKLAAKEMRGRLYLAWTVSSCLLLLALLLGWIVYSRKVSRQNKILMQQLSESNSHSSAKGGQAGMKLLKPADKMIEQLQSLLEDKALLTSPGLNREVLARKLGINETYLRKNIRESFGVSVGEYITALRLHYACELLASPEHSLKEIGPLTGLGTTGTFYRLFHKYFDCSPGDYRKAQMQSLAC